MRVPAGADVLPSNVKLVKKKKKAENSGDKPAKRPKTGKPKPSGGLGLVVCAPSTANPCEPALTKETPAGGAPPPPPQVMGPSGDSDGQGWR